MKAARGLPRVWPSSKWDPTWGPSPTEITHIADVEAEPLTESPAVSPDLGHAVLMGFVFVAVMYLGLAGWMLAMWFWFIPTLAVTAFALGALILAGFLRSITAAKAQRNGW